MPEGGGFVAIREARLTIVCATAERLWLEPLLRAARAGFPGFRMTPLAGGRGGTCLVEVGGHAAVIRSSRRGGLPARLLQRTYFGLRARTECELELTARLHRRGVPVAEPLGTTVQWLFPGCYRSWFATRFVPGATTLWDWLRRHSDARERESVLRAAGKAIAALHVEGVRHPDLNLGNFLVREHDPARVVVIDFDRASVAAVSESHRRQMLQRLERSARKLDPGARVVSAEDLRLIAEASGAKGVG